MFQLPCEKSMALLYHFIALKSIAFFKKFEIFAKITETAVFCGGLRV
jgi:hypothetical protein